MAGAVPLTGVEADVVRVVVAAEREGHTIDRDPVQLAGVTIRLLDLADQGAVHRAATSVAPWEGRCRGRRPVDAPRPVMAVADQDYTPAVTAVTRLSTPDRHPPEIQGALVPSRPKSSSSLTTSSSSGVDTSTSSTRSRAS